MLFEDHAWLLVPLIIATVETWNAAKMVFAAWLKRRAAGRP
ncbi:MAG TPA: hypothetical protein VFV94_15930 [Polyangiaceae bacterium]|nr:hypothetical protein [Polyangiaceae bacterium]